MSPIDADRSVGSATRDLAEAVGRELDAVWRQLAAIYQDAFVESADQPRRWPRLVMAILVGAGIAYAINKSRRRPDCAE